MTGEGRAEDGPRLGNSVVKINLRISVALASALLAICASAFAHHGFSVSFNAQPIVLQTTVTKFAWSNPHCQIYFDVMDDQGKVTHWGSETNAPGVLSRVGWTRNSLKPGDQITITLFPSKLALPYGLVSKIVLADGHELIPVFAGDLARGKKKPE
jgi:hypothetical protein